MSLREELHKVVSDVFAGKDVTEESLNFLYDHGQALVEAVADADRWREFRRMSVTVDQDALAAFEAALPVGDITEADLDAALDFARSKTVDGGGA